MDDFFKQLALDNPGITEIAPEVDPPFILAGNVYRARTRLGLSQAQLAERIGVRQPRIAEIERGDANPRLDTIARVAHALGLSAAALLSDPTVGGVEQTDSATLHGTSGDAGSTTLNPVPRQAGRAAPAVPSTRRAGVAPRRSVG